MDDAKRRPFPAPKAGLQIKLDNDPEKL